MGFLVLASRTETTDAPILEVSLCGLTSPTLAEAHTAHTSLVPLVVFDLAVYLPPNYSTKLLQCCEAESLPINGGVTNFAPTKAQLCMIWDNFGT